MLSIPLLGASGQQEYLGITTACTPATTFDPSIVTKSPCTLRWVMNDGGVVLVTRGLTHAISHTFSDSVTRTVKVYSSGGLDSIVLLDCSSDFVTGLVNIEKCKSIHTLNASSNSGLVLNLSSVSAVIYYLTLGGCPLVQGNLSSVSAVTRYLILNGCSLIQGNLSSVSAVTYYLNLSGCSLVQGDLSSVSAVTYYLNLYGCPLVQGNLSSVGAVTNTLNLYGCSLVEGTTIPKASNVYLGNMGMTQARVDDILREMVFNVGSDPNYYTAAAPVLSIIADDATPSGVYQFAGSPSTGLEYAYYLVHLATHAWSIAWNGGSAP